MGMLLYSYFRSSAAYRVRIALHLKGQPYDIVPVHLLREGGEQLMPAFSAVNPQSLVPVLEVDGERVTQSLAIMEYLEERFPEPPLLPSDHLGRAHVRALALAIACDIHPLNNLRVMRMLTQEAGIDEAMRQRWMQHWIALGFGALEQQLAGSARRGRFCCGDTPTMADCCLVPQIFNARRFHLDMTPYPTLNAIDQACQDLPAFRRAAPDAQPDAA